MQTDFDAIAIGGGLAGSAFAVTLSRAGCRTAVVERTSEPKLKVCGDFLSAEAQSYLTGFGLDVWGMGAQPVNTLCVGAGGRTASAALPFLASGLSRLKLDEALLTHAAEAGAEVLRGRSAGELRFASDRCAVRVGEAWLTARWIALATGKHNFRGWPRAHGPASALKMSFALTPAAQQALANIVQIVGYRGGYIGACNIEGGAATLCWLADQAMMQRSGGRWRAQLDEVSRGSPLVGDLLSAAKPLSRKPAATAAIPYGYRRQQIIHRDVFPLGDQLAVIPSFTGDGTSIALSSGIAAAAAVLAGQDAKTFQHAFLDSLRTQFRWASATNMLFNTALTRHLSVAAIAAAPVIATHLARLTRMPAQPVRSAATALH